jgi:tetratricopeptide (TPR) repeat protein
MKRPAPWLSLLFLLTVCFTLATCVKLRSEKWTAREQSGDLLKVLLGDARRLFANQSFVEADVYFHSGYYPSFFDQAARAPVDARHMVEEHHDGHDAEEEAHERAMDFLGHSKDWIDQFGRHFYPSAHSHLEKPGETREILPWLRLSAELDPQRVETYTVAAWFLRSHLGKVDEAEQFLREGLRANPASYEILFALGQLIDENRHDPVRARNLWEVALRRWQEQDQTADKPDLLVYQEIVVGLARVEEAQGNLAQALHYLEMLRKVSPQPEVVQQQIDELKQKIASPPAPPVK